MTRLTSITVTDETRYYAAGDTYLNEAELTIIGKYNNGKSKEFTIEDMESNSLVKGETSYNPAHPFAEAGTYQFIVKYDGVESTPIDINVLSEHKYVTSIKIDGPTELESKQNGSYTVAVSPSDYTTKLVITSSNENAFQIEETDTGFNAYALKAGNYNLIAQSKSSKDTTISDSIDVNVIASAPLVNMKQTYNDYVKNHVYNLSACPLSGEPRLLVIPIWLTDSSKYIKKDRENVRNDIEKVYFGTKNETGWNSVATYYNEESLGKISLKGTVANWYECGRSVNEIGQEKFDTAGLVKEAVNWYFANNPSDSRSNYDLDNDKYLDGVILIYAAPDYQQKGFEKYENLWAFTYWIQGTTVSNIVPNVFFWASYDFIYGSSTALKRTGSYYYNGDTNNCNLDAHTFIHEMGHVFGLDDYYDYGQQYDPAGGFSMQDYNVGGHDPYSVLSFGWADAYIPSESVTITISEFVKTHDLILLSEHYNSYDSPFDEYFLLELYSPNGLNEFDVEHRYCSRFPTGLNKAGIRLWHVDARLAKSLNGYSFSLAGSNVKTGNIKTAMSNTYYNESKIAEIKNYLSCLGAQYYDFNLLQLIRNNTSLTYQPRGDVKNSDLFRQGDSFNISSYSKQFKNATKFNNGDDIRWSFTVDKIELVNGIANATLTLTHQ
ncbi:MAG: hypothetical protein K5925_01950 [Bacilli bacterium]|nr:hypothetical protein [Bacilli bacterium]